MPPLEELAAEIAEHPTPRVFAPAVDCGLEPLAAHLEARGIPLIRVGSEETAAVMAGVTARLSGVACAALSGRGPGLARMVPGLALCLLEGLPVVAVADSPPLDGAGAGGYRRLDQGALVRAVVKGSRYLAHEGPGFAAMAAWAGDEAPGPAILNLTEPVEDAEDDVPPPPDPGFATGGMARAIQRASRPVAIAGALAERRGWGDRLARIRIPVLATLGAKGVVDETAPNAWGVFQGFPADQETEALFEQADLVVGLGLHAREVPRAAPFPAPAVAVLGWDDQTSRDAFDFAETTGPNGADAALRALEAKAWTPDAPRAPWSPPAIFRLLDARFDGAVRLVPDAGAAMEEAARAWRARRASWFVGSGSGRCSGAALAMAVAAALHDPSVPTVALLDDSGIGAQLDALPLAVERRLPLILSLGAKTGAHWPKVLDGLGVPLASGGSAERGLEAWKPENGPVCIVTEPFNDCQVPGKT